MFHYLFTNDLRISNLEGSLIEAGRCFKDDCVPSASEDKNANNNMMTLGFYFNLTKESECAKECANGDVRKVVLNFIKKFQFPNPRTSASLRDCINDGIRLAPMRVILQTLYMMRMSNPYDAYLTKKEIIDYIFFNEEIAKNNTPDVMALVREIIENRDWETETDIPDDEVLMKKGFYWKQCRRQVREMVKVLTWSGCVAETKDGIKIMHDNLTRDNEADLFEIITYSDFWEPDSTKSIDENKASYQSYMDIAKSKENMMRQDEIENSYDNEYQRAAALIKKHIEDTGLEFERPQENIDACRNEILKRFSPEKLKALSDDELLSAFFYTKGGSRDCLCYWLEVHKDTSDCFGNISGGSAYKFGLFQRRETGVWTTGSSKKPREISYEDALEIGKEIRDAIVKGAEIIGNTTLKSLEEYEELNDKLENELNSRNVNYSWAWFHKYFSIVYPDKLSGFHNDAWQYHILYCFGIKPSQKYYARSGQIAMIGNYAELSYMHLINATNDRFGRPIDFIRIDASSENKSFVEEWKQRSVVGIIGPDIGSLDNYVNKNGIDKTALSNKLSEDCYTNDVMTASRKASDFVRFYKADQNTVFVVTDGQKPIALVDKIGDYFYDDKSEISNLKHGKWNMKFSDNESFPIKLEDKLTSCYEIKEEENVMYLYKKYYYDDEIEDIGITEEEMEEGSQLKTCLEIEREPRVVKIHPLNLIIYGAPGTGKTYSMVDYALAIIDNIGIKDFKASFPDRKANRIRYKELVKAGQIVFTTFHQNYGYEEFIQGLRPDKDSTTLAFKNVDGVFKKIADKALNDENNNYVIIIDEINRANISKVFGELITLIEEDKRWGEVEEMSAMLQSGDPFAVPNNLYIIGTMNSADKSISLIDAALRRRFDFDEQKPDASLIEDETLKTVFTRLNNKLVADLQSTDLLIGHSYFMNKTADDLENIMNRNVIPLLYEYYYDVRTKVAKTVEEAIKDTDVAIVDKKNDFGRLSVERSK